MRGGDIAGWWEGAKFQFRNQEAGGGGLGADASDAAARALLFVMLTSSLRYAGPGLPPLWAGLEPPSDSSDPASMPCQPSLEPF